MRNDGWRSSLVLACVFALLGSGVVSADDGDDKGGGKPDASLNSIASGRLSRYGITAGVAIAVFTPIAHGGVQLSFASGAMPYVEFRPGFASGPAITRAYCVAKYTAANAQSVADQVAFQQAGLSITNLEDVRKLNENDATVLLRDSQLTITNVIAELQHFSLKSVAGDTRGREESGSVDDDIRDLRAIAGGISNAEAAEAHEVADQLRSPEGTSSSPISPEDPTSKLAKGLTEKVNMGSTRVSAEDLLVANQLERSSGAQATIPSLRIQRSVRRLADSLKRADLGFLSYAQYKHLGPESKKVVVFMFIDHMTGWKLGRPGRCPLRQGLGFYLGRPAAYKANVPFTSFVTDPDTKVDSPKITHRLVEIDPVLSLGFTYSPISEIRLMAGVTMSNAVRVTDGEATHVWALTFAVGGNLDLAGALIK